MIRVAKRPFRFYMISAIFIVLGTASHAFALSLGEAKAERLVGEKRNGYVGAVNHAPSAKVQALVKDINTKRKQRYEEIAQKNGTPLSSVEKLAGEKAINKTPPNYYIQGPSGEWARK